MREKHSKPVEYVDVVFVENKEKPPCTMEFVEVENEYRESVGIGEWVKDGEYSRLRIPLAKAEEVKGNELLVLLRKKKQ